MTLDWLRQLLGLPEALHGHIEDTASSGLITALAAARAAAPGPARRRLLRAHALVDDEGGAAARARAADRRRATTPSRCGPTSLDLADACAVVATVGHDLVGRRRPDRRRSPTWRRRRAPGSTSTPPTRARRPSAPSCARHFAGWERADSIGVNPHKWLFTPMDCSAFCDAPARRPAARLQPRARVPPGQTRTSSA